MIAISYTFKGLDKAIRWFETRPSVIQRAMDQSLMNGGNKVRTDVRRALMKVTGAKRYASIVNRTRSRYVGFHQAGVYVIYVKGGPMKLDEFRFRAGPHGISAALWAVDRQFKRSFVLPGKDASNPANFRARLPGGSHSKLRRLYGPNLAKEATDGQPARVFLLSAREHVGQEMAKRLGKAMA